MHPSRYITKHSYTKEPSNHKTQPESYVTTQKMPQVKYFDVLLTVHLSITLVNDQLDAQFFYFIIRLLQSSTCFE